MKKYLVLIVLATGAVNAQEINQAWFRANYSKQEVMIPMRDGVKLYTAIFSPKDASPTHPILMQRTGYSAAPYGPDTSRAYWNTYYRQYLKEGYILVVQDVRGAWMSEGRFEDIRPFIDHKTGNQTDEASDTYDAIDWLVKNLPNTNGNVGVSGISYPGFYSTMAAASNHPNLKAVSPQAPVTNWFLGDDFHHNGAFFAMDGFAFYSSFGKPRPVPTTKRPSGYTFPIRDNYSFYRTMGTPAGLGRLIGDSIAFWKELYEHPNYDAWWQARDARRATAHLEPAMLWVGGNFDAEDNWGAWNAYRAAEKNNPGKDFNKIVMGPWFHGQWADRIGGGEHLGNVHFGSRTSDWYQENIEFPFFQYYLKGVGAKPDIAEATVFLTGSNEWKRFDTWPPANIQERSIYLDGNSRLDWDKQSGKAGYEEYVSDPARPVPYTQDIHFARTREYMTDDQRFASRRPDVLDYETDALPNDVTLTGVVTADLKVSISTTDADFVVKLIDVFPEDFTYSDTPVPPAQGRGREVSPGYMMGGYQMLVHGEIFRGRYRKSFEKPSPIAPGKVETINFRVGDVAHTFKKGHRIMIQVQSSWFPLADRNPQQFVNIYTATPEDYKKSDIRIYHTPGQASRIILPILK